MKEYPDKHLSKVETPACKEIDPKKKRKNKRQLFCPYCCDWRYFKGELRDGYVTISRCQSCGISKNDFWVKKVNKLWGFGVKPRKR